MTKEQAQRIVKAKWFESSIVAVILLNGLVLGLETSQELYQQYGVLLEFANQLILCVFILEAGIKLYAVSPRYSLYFKDGWNVFDFAVIVFSLIPASGQFAMVARLVRLLRVLRLISAIPELRLIVSTLVRSIPSMGNILILMSIVFYIYGVAGFHLYHAHDPEHWRTLGISVLTLFRVVTLEDWTDVMYKAMELHSWSWLYFVSFVLIATFVIFNLFIAVVINNMEQAQNEKEQKLEKRITREELVTELKNTQESLAQLQIKIAHLDLEPVSIDDNQLQQEIRAAQE